MASTKTFLITGASSGLGLSLALCALKHGHRVIGTARNPSVATANHPDFEKLGGSWLKLDVSVPDAQKVVEEAMGDEEARHQQKRTTKEQQQKQQHQPIEWIIISSAGYTIHGTIEDHPESRIDHHFQTNMHGTIRVLKAAIPFLRRNRCGSIMTMSSILGFAPMAEGQVYSAAKFAVEAITESYASLLAPLGVRCVILEPGTFRTNLVDSSVRPGVGDVAEEYRERYARWAEFVERVRKDRQLVKGDPDRFAERVVEIVDSRGKGEGVLKKGTEGGKVLRVLGGPDCYGMWGRRLKELNDTYGMMEEIALSTDFDETRVE